MSEPMIPAGTAYPSYRPRRVRQHGWLRSLAAETVLTPADLVWPLFVHDLPASTPVGAMPGVERLSIDGLARAAAEAAALGIPAVALFPVVDPKHKSDDAAHAWDPENLPCRAVRAVKRETGDAVGIVCDVALDPYTSHGHDGLMVDGRIVNDETVEALCKQSLSLAEAGCHVVAPSDMMDGRVGAIRTALDRAIRAVARDIAEGADMVMVKPAGTALDVIHRVKRTFGLPTLAYQVSGEYSMIRAAAANGWIDGTKAAVESVLVIKRAGADGILTYFAPELARAMR